MTTKTKDEVNELIKEFLLSGLPVAGDDENGKIMDTVVDDIRIIFDHYMPEIKAAAKEYMVTDDLDALIIALLPAHNEIR